MKSYSHPSIGEIHISISKRARRISLKIDRRSQVKLIVPSEREIDRGIAFLRSKENWIVEKLKDLPKQEFIQAGKIPNLGYTLVFKHRTANKISITVKANTITVFHPDSFQETDNQVQEAAQKGIAFALKKEAKNKLPKRTEELAELHGFKFNQLRINSAKTRWGSCSSTDNINLSMSLMLLPQHLIDYVIIHELCHTVHKNHSKDFWNLVGQKLPNYKALTKEIKGFSTHY